MSVTNQRVRPWQIGQSGSSAELRIAMLASFAIEPLAPHLGTALGDEGISCEIRSGLYNRLSQERLDETSAMARWQPHVLFVWMRLEDLWSGMALPLDGSADHATPAKELADTCLETARRWQATLVFVLPAIPEIRPLGVGDAGLATGVFATATRVRELLRARLSGQRGVLILDAEEAVRTIGGLRAYDDRADSTGHAPFSEPMFQQIGTLAGRLIRLHSRPARKVLVLDGDNTLWGGVVGEDGPQGVEIGGDGPGAAYCHFQEYALELRRAGMLLALCSKNDEADVWKVLERGEMRIKREHLAAYRIGWEPKSAGLRAIAAELGLDVGSFVLIDDSGAELAEVLHELPEVACIRMPADPAGWLRTVRESGALDRLAPTSEDLQRATQYQQERERHALQQASGTAEDYRASLEVVVRVFGLSEADVPRLAQLIAKTNQFNLNCRRRSEAELEALRHDERYLVTLAHAQDRFGDYGVVGAAIARYDGQRADLDTFVLSCRAMGRGVEEALLATVFEGAEQRGISTVYATVVEAPRNQPARSFFARFGCETPGVAYALQRVSWPSAVTRR
jgi:FkbH-like protein